MGMNSICALLILASSWGGLPQESGPACKGRVTDERGTPLAGVWIVLHELGPLDPSSGPAARQLGETVSREDGTFHVASMEHAVPLLVRHLVLTARKKGFSFDWHLYRSEEELVGEQALVLGDPVALHGTVQDRDQRPVEGAAVGLFLLEGEVGTPQQKFFSGHGSLDLWHVRTDRAGRFVFPDLHSDLTAALFVRADGYVESWPIDELSSPASGRLSVMPGAEETVVTLTTGSTLEGKAVDGKTGSPLSGVSLVASQDARRNNFDGFFSGKAVVTDGDGFFRFRNLDRGTWTIRPRFDGGTGETIFSGSAGVELGEGEIRQGVTVELVTIDGIELIVLDDVTGEPVGSAIVFTYCEAFGNIQSFRTGEKGRVILPVPIDENLFVQVSKQGYTGLQAGSETEIPLSKKMTMRLEPAAKISGRIIDPDGEAAAGAVVTYYPHSLITSVTDRSGAFSLSLDGPFEVWDQKGCHILARLPARNLCVLVAVKSIADPLEIPLSRAVTLEGRVTDEAGKPVAGARIEAELDLDKFLYGEPFAEAETDASGGFTIVCCPEGCSFTISVAGKGYGTAEQSVVTEDGSRSTIEIDTIYLAKADQTVGGIVVDEDGKPIEGASIRTRGDGQPELSTETDGEGRFRFDGVCPGEVSVWISLPDDENGMSTWSSSKKLIAGSVDERIVMSRESPFDSAHETWVMSDRPTPKSLSGNGLPGLKALSLDRHETLIRNRSVLLCFFDLNQRPSRHFVSTLRERTAFLEKSGVVLLGVETSGSFHADLDGWMKKHGLDFPVGSIGGDVERTLAEFGVNCLPWLILTSSDHVVRFENLRFDEIEARVGEL